MAALSAAVTSMVMVNGPAPVKLSVPSSSATPPSLTSYEAPSSVVSAVTVMLEAPVDTLAL